MMGYLNKLSGKKPSIPEDEAFEWLVQLDDPETTAEDRQVFEAWLAVPENKEAFEAVSETWYQIPYVEGLAELEPLRQKTENGGGAFWRTLGRQPWRPAMAVAFAVLVMVSAITWYGGFRHADGLQTTQVAQIRELKLADGSVVSLGAKSRVDIDFSDDTRHVSLLEGEAFFSVTPDAKRPFVVTANTATVTVKGTKFNVRSGVEQVSVAVMEGTVEVRDMSGPQQDGAEEQTAPVGEPEAEERVKLLTAGEKTDIMFSGGFSETGTVNPVEAGGWRAGQLFYDDASLLDVIADANRYSKTKILIGDERLGDIRITASFQAHQVDKMLRALETAFPLRVSRDENGAYVLLGEEEKAG